MITSTRTIDGPCFRRTYAAVAFTVIVVGGSTLHAAPPTPIPAPKASPGAPGPKPAASSAPASSSSRSETSRDGALRDRARLGLETDELPESLAALRALHQVDPSVAATCNLGLVARRLGSSVEAAEHLTRCVATWRLVPPEIAERARIEGLAAELAMARAAVAVVSLKAPPNASVTIDDRSIGSPNLDREYFLEPGVHSFRAKVGAVTITERVQLDRGSVRTIQLVPPPSPTVAPHRNPWPVIGGWSLTALATTLGGAMLAASAVNYGVAADEQHNAEQAGGGCFHPDSASHECAAFLRAERLGGNFADAAVASFIFAGAVAVGTTIYMGVSSTSAPRAVVGSNFIKVVVPW